MFYISLIVMILAFLVLPWWSLIFVCFISGAMSASRKTALHQGLAAGLTWSALAFVKDGQSYGLVSQRMAGLLGLPASPLTFAIVFVLGFVTAVLCFLSGGICAELFNKHAKKWFPDVPF